MTSYYYSLECNFFPKKEGSPSTLEFGEVTRCFRKAIDIMNDYVQSRLQFGRYGEIRIMRYEDGKPQSEGVEVARVNYADETDSVHFYLK